MTKEEIKSFLRDKNLTESELDDMWEYCSSFPEYGGEIVKKLKSQKINWRDLNIVAASTLPDLFKKIEEKVLNSILNGNGEIN